MRRVLIEKQTPKAVATAFGICLKTVSKWVERFQAEDEAGLQAHPNQALYTPKPTVRLSASSKQHFANGPMRAPMTPQSNGPMSSHTGSIATIGTDLMVASKPKRPSVVSP